MQFSSVFTIVGCMGGAGGKGPVYTVEFTVELVTPVELVRLVEFAVELVRFVELVRLVELVGFVELVRFVEFAVEFAVAELVAELVEMSIGAKGMSKITVIAIKKCKKNPRHGIAQRNASIPPPSFLTGVFFSGTWPYDAIFILFSFHTYTMNSMTHCSYVKSVPNTHVDLHSITSMGPTFKHLRLYSKEAHAPYETAFQHWSHC